MLFLIWEGGEKMAIAKSTKSIEIVFVDGQSMKVDDNVRINLKSVPDDSTIILFLHDHLFNGDPEDLLFIESIDSFSHVTMSVLRKNILRLRTSD